MITLSCVSTEKKSRYYLNSGLNFIHKIKKKNKPQSPALICICIKYYYYNVVVFFFTIFTIYYDNCQYVCHYEVN